ncbi:hypothetical protein GT347_18380 [Xylophilus rhododendri]|uniref:Uncharacterized protein n=1 Tax=Xylophilus rhododendri TaxID=2697032 RepID=A0A857J975_9BURK|nr:hypothetical protein [Xylophilus rhododendri]QHI99773.1 hypothetical protein GT347_18380 [Xylophilus rhododendri]
MQQFFSNLAWPVQCPPTYAHQALGLCTARPMEPDADSGIIERTEESPHWKHPEMVLSPDLQGLLCMTATENGTVSQSDVEFLSRMKHGGVDEAVQMFRPCLRKHRDDRGASTYTGPYWYLGNEWDKEYFGTLTHIRVSNLLEEALRALDEQMGRAVSQLETPQMAQTLARHGLLPEHVRRELQRIDEAERKEMIEQVASGTPDRLRIPTTETLLDMALKAARQPPQLAPKPAIGTRILDWLKWPWR